MYIINHYLLFFKRFIGLKSNNIEDPINVITGNVIVNDERALFNNQWKLYYSHFIHDNNSEKIFELYNIQNDPYEKNDLSSEHPEIFESMKNTLINMPIVIETPYINPVQSYLYGDRYIGINDSPWLKRDYKEEDLPHPIVQNIIFNAFTYISI